MGAWVLINDRWYKSAGQVFELVERPFDYTLLSHVPRMVDFLRRASALHDAGVRRIENSFADRRHAQHSPTSQTAWEKVWVIALRIEIFADYAAIE